MDKLDIKILRELVQGQAYPYQTDFRRSFREIGKKFQVDEDTVKNRVDRLRKLGLWEGSWLLVNPNLLGLSGVTFAFDVPPESKDDLIPKLRLIEDVRLIKNYYGSLIGMHLCCESEQSIKKRVELVSRVSNTEKMLTASVPYPKCEISLSKTDWEIVRNIERNPRKSYSEISKELSVSSKTVKRRLERMVEGKALFVGWSANLEAFEGAILADLRVIHDSQELRGEVDRKIISRLEDYLYYSGPWEGFSIFPLILPSVSKMQEIVKWAKEQRGVGNARIDILLERIVLFEQSSEALEKKFRLVLSSR